MEEEAAKRGIEFETMKVKGDFVEQSVENAGMYGVDVLLMDSSGSRVK